MGTIMVSVFVSLLAIGAYAYCTYLDRKEMKEQK